MASFYNNYGFFSGEFRKQYSIALSNVVVKAQQRNEMTQLNGSNYAYSMPEVEVNNQSGSISFGQQSQKQIAERSLFHNVYMGQ